MTQANLFLSSQNPHSKRYAVLEDDGTSAWLYITAPGVERPEADCFVYNRIPPIPPEKLERYRGGPPPVTTQYAAATAYQPHPASGEFHLVWSKDGEAASVIQAGKPIACIIRGHKGGYSRNLVAEGPYGHPWDEALYHKTFTP